MGFKGGSSCRTSIVYRPISSRAATGTRVEGGLLLGSKQNMRRQGVPSPVEADAVALYFTDAMASRASATSIARSNMRRGKPISEVRRVIAQIALANKHTRHPGQVTHGYYTVEGDTLTMTDVEGRPIRDNRGDFYTHKLAPGDEAGRVAQRLTKRIREGRHGKASTFTGQIVYARV
jgi:hypothetical protein